MLLKNSGDALPLSPNANIYVAGRNADNIGNQAGGWTIQWQGASGDIIPGTTILEGIREVAPQATVTYSIDASAPMTGARRRVSSWSARRRTPRASATSEGPLWGFYDPGDNGRPAGPPKTMQLSDADAAAVNTVCAQAVKPCVVLVVSGLPG